MEARARGGAGVRTFVREYKTSSEDIGLGSTYWTRLTLDGQISKYMVGAQALGFAADGVQYDVLRKPALHPFKATPVESRKYTQPSSKACPECKRKGGAQSAPHAVDHEEEGASVTLFCVDGRVVTDPGGRLYKNLREQDETPEEYRNRLIADIAADPNYQRGIVVRLESEVQDAAFDDWQTAEQIRVSRKSGRWPRNPDACSFYNRLCDFWEVCSGTASLEDPLKFEAGQAHRELDGRAHLPLFTNSSSRAYRACPKRYFFAYEQGVRARSQAAALAFGTRMHTALAAWLLSGQSLEAALAALGIKPEAYTFDDAKAEAMMHGYHARWAGDGIETVAVEKEFITDLRNPETGGVSRSFVLSGKLDAVVRDHS
jgi:hypothetical protein